MITANDTKEDLIDMAKENPKIAIAIPVYNHGDTLREVAERALAVNNTVIIVDDGSTDGGLDSLIGLKVRIVQHPKNRGKGTAILTAAREAGRLGMTHIVTIDADGQHDPDDFARFVPVIEENPLAVVVGKRDFESAQVPSSSDFGRKFSNFWLRVQTGLSIGDTQSGFRAYPLQVLDLLKLREKRYSFEVEVLVKSAWAGIRLEEVDVSVFYPPETERVSHFNKFWDNVRLSLLNTRLTMLSVLPLPRRKIVPDADCREKVTVLHPIRSIKMLLTENASPDQLAAAAAIGVLLGTLPLIACHTIAILFSASYFRLNKIAALAASQLCMPPLVPALCIEVGYYLRHGHFLTEVSLKTLGYEGLHRLYEWLIGSLLVAPVLAALVGGIVYLMAILIQREIRANDTARRTANAVEQP